MQPSLVKLKSSNFLLKIAAFPFIKGSIMGHKKTDMTRLIQQSYDVRNIIVEPNVKIVKIMIACFVYLFEVSIEKNWWK